jgi:hypothetical protein
VLLSNFPAIREGIAGGEYGFFGLTLAPAQQDRSPRSLVTAVALSGGNSDRLAVNSLFVIVPYKYEGMWVFDDPRVGLVREPFIAGIDTMIDRLVARIPEAERGFRAIFSAAPFPGHTERLDWRREESGGNWYYSDRFEMEGWLCPALFNYFTAAPRMIYVQVEPTS